VITAPDLISAVGPALFEMVVTGKRDGEVRDVFLADPQEAATGQPGDLVLGLGLRDAEDAVELVERCAASNASGVVLRTPLAHEPAVVAAAEKTTLTLVALQPSVTWAHVVWLMRGVIDRAAAPDSPAAGDAGVHQELFALADAAAAIVDAPVTIEDNQSRVLAYSSGQDFTEVANHFEAQGTQDSLIELSGVLKTYAVGLVKICNDLRWMGSGPTAGLAEIHLQDLHLESPIRHIRCLVQCRPTAATHGADDVPTPSSKLSTQPEPDGARSTNDQRRLLLNLVHADSRLVQA